MTRPVHPAVSIYGLFLPVALCSYAAFPMSLFGSFDPEACLLWLSAARSSQFTEITHSPSVGCRHQTVFACLHAARMGTAERQAAAAVQLLDFIATELIFRRHWILNTHTLSVGSGQYCS